MTTSHDLPMSAKHGHSKMECVARRWLFPLLALLGVVYSGGCLGDKDKEIFVTLFKEVKAERHGSIEKKPEADPADDPWEWPEDDNPIANIQDEVNDSETFRDYKQTSADPPSFIKTTPNGFRSSVRSTKIALKYEGYTDVDGSFR